MSRDEEMLKSVLPFSKPILKKGQTDVVYSDGDKNTSLKLILLPQWAHFFPPFNLTRLAAVATESGYKSSVLDLNIKLFNVLKELQKKGVIDYNPWDGPRHFKWMDDTYYNELHPLIESTMNEYVDKVILENPTVVGFTLYWGNIQTVTWFARRIQERNPNIILILGGPGATTEESKINTDGRFMNLFDYVVLGEGEELLLEILEEVENGKRPQKTKILTQPDTQRLNINNFPIPDYSSFDFNEYLMPNGILTELSRGCTAKCTFCAETHFWKYRQREAISALDEIEHLNKTRGTEVVWFLDSLVNGNLIELRKFCKGIVDRNLKIKWMGYSRCDGRMDLDYFKDLAISGCHILNVGCESGSNKVLADIKKNVTTEEMEQNFIDAKVVNIGLWTQWMIGFPTEEYQDFADTLKFIWRNRNRISVISYAPHFGISSNVIVGQNPERFGISNFNYLGDWMRSGFTLTKIHLLVRSKSFSIFTQQLVTKEYVQLSPREDLRLYHYTIEYNNPTITKQIEFEKFDYNIINPELNPLIDSLINEIFVLFRTLWKSRGGYKIKVLFNPELDVKEYGVQFDLCFNAEYEFEISDDGEWKGNFIMKFEQPQFPFSVIDYSDDDSIIHKRSRRLAKSKWGMKPVPKEYIKTLHEEKKILEQTIDYSFDYSWNGSGSWKEKKQLI